MVKKRDYITNWNDIPLIVDPPYVAWLLGCSRENVRKMCQSGKIKAFKVGDMWRIKKESIVEYIKGKSANRSAGSDCMRSEKG